MDDQGESLGRGQIRPSQRPLPLPLIHTGYIHQTHDKKTGFRTRSVLALPVKDEDGNVVACVQFINKLSERGEHLPDGFGMLEMGERCRSSENVPCVVHVIANIAPLCLLASKLIDRPKPHSVTNR